LDAPPEKAGGVAPEGLIDERPGRKQKAEMQKAESRKQKAKSRNGPAPAVGFPNFSFPHPSGFSPQVSSLRSSTPQPMIYDAPE
jgi:hypothetical protein